MLRNSPGFTSVAVLSLRRHWRNTAVFSLIDDLLLRTVNVRRSGPLVSLHRILPRENGPDFSMPIFEEIRDHNHVLSGTVGFSWSRIGISITARPRDGYGRLLSGNYFSVLGVRPLLGERSHRDDKAGANAVALMIIRTGPSSFRNLCRGKTISASDFW